ncbi:hypothetical protein FWH13_02905 [Candidatus Saccharibacteria bacterium]|nr:hypothetical protein [Candidatus Saccharibacteria bacterium]
MEELKRRARHDWIRVKKWWKKLDARRKKGIVFGGLAVVVLLVGVIWWSGREDLIKINGLRELTAGKPTDAETLRFIQGLLLDTINMNVDEPKTARDITDAEVREGSFEQVDEVTHTVSFVVDIPSLQQSYNVSYQWSNDGGDLVQHATMVWCPRPEQLVFPAWDCRDMLTQEAAGAGGEDDAGAIPGRPGVNDPLVRALPVSSPLFRIVFDHETGAIQTNVGQEHLNEAISWLRRREAQLEGVMLANYDLLFVPGTPFGELLDTAWATGASAEEILRRNYATVMVGFEVDETREVGEYMVTLLWSNDTRVMASYRAVFRAEGAWWKLVAPPQPLLTVYNTPGVAVEVLSVANGL